MKRVATYALFTLAGVLIGFPLGFRHAQRTVGEGGRILSQTLALTEYETLANLQYKQADPAHGTEAQLDLLSFMQQVQATQEIAMPRSMDYDQAQALMRLALLDEQAGYSEGFQRYLRRAQEALNHSDRRWYSEKQMREFVAHADQESQY